jgi:hypothetical protein
MMLTSFSMRFLSFINSQNMITCLIVWFSQSYRHEIDITSRIFRLNKKLTKSIFSIRIWIDSELSIFFNWSCNFRCFFSMISIWDEVDANTISQYVFHFCFQRAAWKMFIFFFVVDKTSCARDLIERDSFTRRKRRSSRIADLWTIIISFMFAWIHSRFFDAFEIDLDSHSICSLFCRIFCELSSTCRRHACDIARVIVVDSSVNRWKRRMFRSRESKWMWREKFQRCFENICFVWQRACWWFSFSSF